MRIIIDTNFMITLVKEKISLDESLEELFGIYKLVVPIQVIKELEKLSEDKKQKVKDREATKISLQLLKDTEKINLEKEFVDAGIIKYVKDHKATLVATLDKELKQKIRIISPETKFLTIRAKKKIEVQ
ncbi:MAG: hypothetical protein U9Q06_03990 [Nanoarchaeota archaeon]|nr:hypothetical protein [Nanoarchaeota archaeon]